MRGSVTAQVILDGAKVGEDRRLGEEGSGFRIALDALDSGRLGIAASAVGLAQAALNVAVQYPRNESSSARRSQPSRGLFHPGGHGHGIAAGRALYLDAARRRDAGEPSRPRRPWRTSSVPTWPCRSRPVPYRCSVAPAMSRISRSSATCGKGVLQIVEGTNEIQRWRSAGP